MAKFIDAQGATQEFNMNMDVVRDACAAGISVRDHVNALLPTNVALYGDTFTQLCASEGIVLVPSKRDGMRAPTLNSVVEGRTILEAGAIVRDGGSQARVLLTPAIGALIEDKLLANLDQNANAFDAMIAHDETIADEWLLWPEINFAGPEAGRSQVTTQLSKPASMMSVTTSEKQIRIPTYALGIEWSEQSSKYVKLDLLALAIARQVAVERNERAGTNLLNILNGDADVGQASLASLGKSVTALSLDAAATAGITQLAWMKWLYANSTKRMINALVTDLAGAMAIENRTGRPVVTGDNPMSPRIDSTQSVMNPGWQANLPIFIVDPSVGWPAKTILGIDTRFGLHRVSSTNASYSAQEDFALRRAHAMRWDFGQIVRRLFTDAFDVLTYA